ncbi:MAG: anthranilate synthase component I [Candidatus Omnitrophica bacterium]|jgi:anthranilate synthase component 1|nr:anthranilate synthase component I [Candidatus Omnitrophota bacterium]MDD5725686.1 anthranilate synthase component I [Candidatus Omnitrophota bacterium]
MYTPNLKDFLKLTVKGNLIPVYKQIDADLDTPVSAFLKMEKGDYSFLLESVEGQEKIARYSFLGTNPSMIFKSRGKEVEITYPFLGKKEKFITSTSPLDEIKKIMRDMRSVQLPGLPRFYGGLVGYLGYDTVRFIENIPDKNPDSLKIPDILLMMTDSLLIFDRLNHTIKILNNVIVPKGAGLSKKKALYKKAVGRIEKIHAGFNRSVLRRESLRKSGKLRIESNLKKHEFLAMVRKCKEYIKKGDIIQVVPSQRFKVKTQKDDFSVYRSLRILNPSPYMYYFNLKDFSIVGSSPEILVRCEDGLVQTRPIAGTRRRGKDAEEDAVLEKELLNDEKERAEHLMLVDLGRNDLGRISKIGQVKVDAFMRVEKYSHVMHLVSEVSGILDKKRFDIYDVLKAAFPAGTVSGSPKIRAMQIIDELENLRRSLYAGAIGYFSFSHNLDTCIAIRTIIFKDGFAYVQSGGGIVADSVPEKEYQESVNKAKAMMEAIAR